MQATVEFPTTSDVNATEKKPIHVLHVDEDPCLLEASKQILSMENNFDVDVATSVDEALKKMEKQTYDVVVSDYEMPTKNGLDLLKELREQQNDVPFILFTGKGREVVVKALNLGADGYINKHGTPETVYCELAHAINKTVERKKLREALVTSESKYRTLVEKSLQGILVTKEDPLRLVYANEAMGKFLGYSVKELTSLSPEGIMGLVYPKDRAVFFKRVENRFRGEPAESCLEFRAVRKDGSIIWLNAFANRVDYDGQLAVEGMVLDVTERKKTELELMDLAKFPSENPNPILRVSKDNLILYANTASKSLLKGLNVEIGQSPPHFLVQPIAAALKSGLRQESKCENNQREFLFTIAPMKDASYVNVYGLDITERQKAEQNQEKELHELNQIIDSFPMIIFYKDKEGKLIRVNEAFAEALKISKENFLGKTVFDLCSAEIARGMANDDLEVLQSGRPKLGIIEQYESASGMRWVQTDKVPIFDKKGILTGLVGFAQDITERKKLERANKEQMDMLEAITENIGAGFKRNRHGISHALR
jgi:PAS domain S-box-containing protein